jgi:hypothetical protein
LVIGKRKKEKGKWKLEISLHALIALVALHALISFGGSG